MTNINANKIFLILLAYICSIFSISFAKSENDVSDRELLILTTLSYSNEQTVNKSAMVTEEFLNKYGIDFRIISPDEISEWKVLNYEINNNTVKSGFSVYTFQKGNNVVIVPRGTDGGLFSENWRYLISNEHPQAKYIEGYILDLIPQLSLIKDCKIYICGHSLGGYLSLYGAGVILNSPEMHKHFVKVVTFNGLGLGQATNPLILSKLYKLEKNQIINYRISNDIVSYFGNHITLCTTFNLINSPLIKSFKSGWYFFPIARSHNLASFFFHKPFLKQSEEKENSHSSNNSTQNQNLTTKQNNGSNISVSNFKHAQIQKSKSA